MKTFLPIPHLSLTIFNSLSKEIVSLELPPFGETTIPFQTFTAGMYFLHATDDTGKRLLRKRSLRNNSKQINDALNNIIHAEILTAIETKTPL